MWRGVRARITALAAVVVIIVLVAAAAVLLATQRRLLTDNLDETLASRAEELALTNADVGSSNPLPSSGDDDSIAQIATAGGEVIASSANYGSQPALPPPAGNTTRARTAHLLPGEPDYRILSMRVGDHIVHVASPLDDIDESISALRLGLTGAIPVVAVVLAALIWWLVGRTLRPVEAIRREVANISGSSLHRRVPEPATNDEIHRLALTMNAMLDRVERSSASQQRFVADASHELRSPLTRLRSELEVDVAHPSTADLLATHRSVLDETMHMQRLMEDLLVLARHDDNSTTAPPDAAVDLDDIVLDEIRRVGLHPGVDIDASAVSAAQVGGDVSQLARLVRNLLDNAIRHSNGTVTVTLAEHDCTASLTITDDGPGIAPEHHERVFERFSRLDDARTRDDGGSGLGLAIASAITKRHHGTIRIDAQHESGARFVVEIPSMGALPRPARPEAGS